MAAWLVVGFPFIFVLSEVPLPAAGRWDLGSKEHAEVLELSSPKTTSVLGKKQPWPYQVHMLLMESRKTLWESYNRLCETWFPRIDIPVTVCAHLSGCRRLRALPSHLLQWLGGLQQWCAERVRPLCQSQLWLLYTDYRQFQTSGSQGSSSYSEVICLPCLFLFSWVCCCYYGFFLFVW